MSIVDSAIQSPPAAPPTPGSLPRRIADTFVSPGALFERFTGKVPWLDVLIISAIVSALVVALIPGEILETQIREQMARNPNTPANFDPSSGVMMGRVFGVLGALLGTIIMSAIIAGIYRLVSSMVGGEATYEQTMGVVSHSALIGALGALLTLPIIILAGDVNRQLTFALLAPGLSENGFLFKFLNWLNVFTLWQLGVISLGLATINRPRMKIGTAAGVVYGIYLAFAVVFALIGSMMASG